jgi:hypothetical protein
MNPNSKKKEIYELKIRVERLPDSLNKKLNKHYLKRHSENKRFDHLIHFHCLNKLPTHPLTKAKIKIVRHSHRTLDFDGLVGSFKPVVDALVSCGVLKDDSWNVLGCWIVDQVFLPKSKDPFLEILVQECPNEI